jgi:MFS family permease
VSFVAGPIVGGLLVEHVSWESVFLLNVPIAALACLTTVRFAPESRDPAVVRSYDVPGFVLLSAGLFLVVFALVQTHAHGWGSPRTLGVFAAGLAVLALLVLREARTHDPMLPLDIFRPPPVLTAATTILTGYLVSLGVIFFWGLYLQQTLRDSPIEAGVHLLPNTASFVVGCAAAAWVAVRIGRRWTMIGGMVATAAATAWLGRFDITDGYGTLWLPLAAVGLSLAFCQVVAMQTLMDEIPERHAGIAGGLLSGASQLGAVLGIAILGSVFASSGIHNAMYVAAAIELGAAVIAVIALRGASAKSR